MTTEKKNHVSRISEKAPNRRRECRYEACKAVTLNHKAMTERNYDMFMIASYIDENYITERFHKAGKYTEYVSGNVYTMTEKQTIKAYEMAARQVIRDIESFVNTHNVNALIRLVKGIMSQKDGYTFTDRTEKIIKAFCTDHGGKMSDVISVSTSPLENKYCQERAKIENSICSHCYSIDFNTYRKGLKAKLKRNTALFTTEVIPVREWPVLPAFIEIFRLEAFGDLGNVIQAQNYINFCKANENRLYNNCMFALWTKNIFLLTAAFKYTEKPGNMIIIYSSPCVNLPAEKALNIPFIDKVFTVYDNKETAEEHNAKINCGANNCNTCRRCYSRRTAKLVNELLK